MKQGLFRGLTTVVLVGVLTMTAGAALAGTPQTELVSVDSSGTAGNDESFEPSLSADGRYVAFDSRASNLTPEGSSPGTVSNILVHDRTTGDTQLVDPTVHGDAPNGFGFRPSISADGHAVAFYSNAANLTRCPDRNDAPDVFVRDLDAAHTRALSLTANGRTGNEGSFDPEISANGRYVAFASFATNLLGHSVPGDENIYVFGLKTGKIRQANRSSHGVPAGGRSSSPSISGNGRYVAYASTASNGVKGDHLRGSDIFVRDMTRHRTALVSRSSSGIQANGKSYAPSISADGHHVAFSSKATNLVPGPDTFRPDIFVRDLKEHETARISQNQAGDAGNSRSQFPSISKHGGFIAFVSEATNLVPDDTNGDMDAFVADRHAGTLQRVSVDSPGNQGAEGSSDSVSLSSDGGMVAFDSASAFDPQSGGHDQIYVRGPLHP
jgi:Tol biopolymer transport system component